MRSDVIFQSSPWWILVCLLIGAAYAFFMYQPRSGLALPKVAVRPGVARPGLARSGVAVGGFDRRTTYGLAALRFVLVSLLCFLLLNPLIRSLRTLTEKPKVVLAIDNSESMAVAGRPALNRALAGLQTIRQQLTDKGLDVRVRTLGDTITDTDLTQIPFTRRTSDLSGLLSGIRSDYEGRNLTDVVLVSDGIFNQGLSPTFGQYPFAVQAVGLGDTIPRRDIQLRGIVANRIAYLGNQFPVQAEIVSNGFQGRSATVVLRQGGRELARQTVNFGQNNAGTPDRFNQFTFQTTATQKGVQHYVVEVLPQPGEFSTRNNRQDVYIDVIDGKEKVLLLALSPHPDIKAIRNILEKNQNYELDIRILTGAPQPGTPADAPAPADKTYDLIILHQIPDNGGVGNVQVQKYLAKNTPVLFVLGNQSSMGPFNTSNSVMQVNAQPNQSDKVTGVFNPDFRQLNLDPAKLELLAKLPPLSAPYGDFRLQPGSEVVLWQQVGSIRTTKPLLAINVTSPRKTAVLAGEGLWSWRLEEYALTDKQEVVDELFQKIIQLISVKEDRRKLRVYPIRNEFVAGEKVIFETELYNDIYERVYDRAVRLEINDEKGLMRSYNYTPTAANSRFEISRLPEGAYRLRASVNVNNRAEQSAGQFVVRDLQLEALNTTADHGLLRQLAQQTGGQFYGPNRVDDLVKNLTSHQRPARLTSTEEMNELINWRWLFFVVLTLATIEWGLRKFYGGY